MHYTIHICSQHQINQPENQLQHDIFTVQRQKSPEKTQGHHAELQNKETINES